MNLVNTIPQSINKRIEEMIDMAWMIFVNQFISDKYVINLEAPFQLHFSSILKSVGELYCLNKDESFHINLEVNMGEQRKNYVDIVLEYNIASTGEVYKVPIELKYRTLSQSAEDIGVMEIYNDIYNLEKLTSKTSDDTSILPFSYFFCITNNQRYIKKPGSGLKTVFVTYDEATIKPNNEYKYLDTNEGLKFYNKYGAYKFDQQYKFKWHQASKVKTDEKYWFLKMKIGSNENE
ncbi:hypothetical protein [Tissierella sp. Yu-01]|uniref:hypothetical protein n=1 Tax=Tissierella sp. Yu-01 TaxID=3035694 RepID=UPI00240DE781|nr:hypothetical protein [Tissierella sp. Yu-01]WFA07620.1 hypothetical protein P3962_07640 [Tissierella sp. Yu-01]